MICRFERSTLPEHAGKRVVVVRVVRMVENDPIRQIPPPAGVNYPDIETLRPRVGELLKKVFRGNVEPWSVDVGERWKEVPPASRKRALRVLFDNEGLYGSPPLGGDVV